jgi:hypothetical protein
MPISSEDLKEAAKVALNHYLRNAPVDQIAVQHPFLKHCQSKRIPFHGALKDVVENVRKEYGSNAQWTYGEKPVEFNKRHTTEMVGFPWRRMVDGMHLDHDRLFAAGIDVREGERGKFKIAQHERVQLLNLLNEQREVLQLGFQEKLDLDLHRSGVHSPDAITGLDALVSTTPDKGVVGGLDRAKLAWWRNYAHTGIATKNPDTLSEAMDRAWQHCIVHGGVPNLILAGSAFLKAYRNEVTVVQNADAGRVKTIDTGVGKGASTGMYYKGVEIVWDPVFTQLDAIEAPLVPWGKRCYFLNMQHLKYYDDGLSVVTPVRPHDILALYAMVNLRCVLTTNRSNAHAVLAIA